MGAPDKAELHQSKAREYLAEAQRTTDLTRRAELLQLCEDELAKAMAERTRKKREAPPDDEASD